MNKHFKLFLAIIVTTLIPLRSIAQQPVQTKLTEINIHNVTSIEERVFLIHSIQENEFFTYRLSDEEGKIDIYVTDDYTCQESNANDDFDAFIEQLEEEWMAYNTLDKNERGRLFVEWRYQLEDPVFLMINEDFHRQLRDNNTCEGADPFCTDNGLYQFPAGVNAGNLGSSTTPYYCSGFVRPNGQGSSNCLTTTPNPAFYYMQIDQPGNLNIYMYSTPSHDIDFDCWGPFSDINTACSQLSCSNMVDCSYSINSTENCHINNAQTGQYYILLITNYSNATCNISFSNIGTGTTNCGILPPLVDNDGPYCVGETIHLTANGQPGSSYSWTGPGGFTSTQQNPTRPNCTMAMAGTYTCTITVGSATNSATTEVVVYPQPTANFNFTTVCLGETTQFTSTSTTNPSGQQITSFLWDFGDGQTSTQQNPSHQYATAGSFHVTLTVSCGNGLCTSTKTQNVAVYAAPVANAGPDQTIPYGSTAQLSGSGGSGTFNFHWEPANMVANANAQNTQTVPLTQDQTYTLTVTNPQGECSSTDEVTIHINGGAMTVTAYADPSSICQGGSTQLVANAGGGTGNFTYSWTPTTALSNPNIYNPVASPTQTTTYTCNVSDGQTSQNVSVTVIVNDIIVEDEYMTICPDDVYHWHGTPYSGVGTYQFDTVTSQGCLKTIYLHLDHHPTYDETTVEAAVCFGESYAFYGSSYNTSIQTQYTDHTVHGCDSIVRLNLTVYPDNGVTQKPVTVCPEQLPYSFYGVDYYEETDVTVLDTDIHDCDSAVRLILTISDHYEPPTVHKYVGYYDTPSYNWYIPEANTTLTYTEDGLYTETLPTSSCEGIFSLDLHFGQIPETVVIDTTVCDRFDWYVKGTYVGTYTDTRQVSYDIPLCYDPANPYTQYMYYDPSDPNNPRPCFESYELHLTVNYESVDNVETYDGIQNHICDVFPYYNPNINPYIADGDTLYYHENISATLDGKTPEGCPYSVRLNVKNMQYTPHPVIDCSDYNVPNPHWPITATEFNVNRYTYQVIDHVSDISRWNMSQCKWEISKESWRIVPNPSGNNPLECMVYAMDWVPDSICLSFKAVNSCSGSEGVVAEYWLHPSFYGVEEQEAYPAAVTVIPNPNNGQMRLQFDNIQGDLDIKVYSLTGTLVDAFGLKSIEAGQSHEYSMKRLMNGIYFFTVSDGKRSVTKKVVVIH